MKVPTIQSNRVAEGSGQLAYLQTPSNLGDGWNALARGISSLGGALSQYGAAADAEAKQREEKTKRFDALTALNDFELETDIKQTELKRDADPSGKNFAQNAQALWDKRAQDFISSKIPQDLQEEFKYRLSENKQRVLRDAYDFQYKAGDAWFRKGVDEQLNKARTEISANPDKLGDWQKKMDEVIAATDLSEMEKADLREKVHVGLVATEYYQQVKKQATEANDVGVTNFDNDLEAAKALIRKEEGFRNVPYWDTNAHRVGYGSDTTVTADGKVVPVTKGMNITRDDAERDLQYRLDKVEGAKVRSQLGDTWNQLSNEVKAALYSVGYNYGSLPQNVVRAAKSGDMQALAAEVEGLDANKTRRSREAAIIRGTRSIDLDEKYAAIPFDDRVQIRNAAEREAKADFNEQQKLLLQQQETARNDLYVGLLDGTKNETDIQSARDTGLLTDIDHITKAQNILDKRNEQVNLTSGFNDILTSGRPFDPTNDDEKKMYNAWVGPDGINKLMSGDKEYFSSVIKPAYEKVGAMATDVAGAFQGMMRSGNLQHRQFALDALAQLQDANPIAFAAQIPEALQRQVDYWDARKGFYDDPEELITQIQGGTTQEERQRRMSLRKDAEHLLSKSEDGVPTIDNLMGEVLKSFDTSSMPWNANPQFSADPVQKQAMYQEFQTHFVDEYERYGTVEEAKAAAIKTMQATWGVSPIGDGTLMKYPPDKIGYKPGPDGTYKWIDLQLRNELNINSAVSYELVADEKTRQEWEAYRAGSLDRPPTYRVMLKDENGVWRDPSDDPTKRPRIWFQKTQQEKQKENAQFDYNNEIYTLQTRMAEIIQMKMALDRAKPGAQLPDEVLKEEKDIQERLGVLNKPTSDPANANDSFDMPSVDIMGNPN